MVASFKILKITIFATVEFLATHWLQKNSLSTVQSLMAWRDLLPTMLAFIINWMQALASKEYVEHEW